MILIFAVILVALSIVAGFFITNRITPEKENNVPEATAPAQSGVREVLIALRDYNKDLGTDTAPYPSDIHELESRGYIESVTDALGENTYVSGDWLYFSAADSEYGAAPLLISPLHFGEHIVSYVDGSASDVSPEKVAEFVAQAPYPPQRIPVKAKARANWKH